ncbi:MAG: fibronectin type III domain-containing protein [Myxococcota bacterium]
MQKFSSSAHTPLRFLPLVLLAYLPGCSASDLTAGELGETEHVAAASEALTIDLTPTLASNVTDLRNVPPGEFGIDKIYDNNLSTKLFLTHDQSWIQYRLTGPSLVTRYEISRSADNFPDRVPTAWTLEGSHEGITWYELDKRDGQTLGAPTSYPLSNTTAYLYYRLYIRDNHTNDNGHTELAEFRIFGEGPSGTVPGAASNVTASVNSNTVTLNWSAATNATGYLVQRIGDDGSSVVETPTTSIGYVDANLAPGTTYIYQIQAVNNGRRGPVSTTRAMATTASAANNLKDITALIATAPTDEHGKTTGDESISMVTDNNPYTKYYQPDGTTWIQQEAPVGSVVSQYTLTSANDEPTRDPRSWVLEGSTNGTSWTTLDSRSNQSFLTRHQTRVFTCNPQGLPYTYYRLTILATQRPVTLDTQLAEFRLFGTTSATLAKPAAPSNLQQNTYSYRQDPDDDNSPLVTGPVLTSNQVGLKFVDNASKRNPETSFVLERSTSNTFSNITSISVGANSTSTRAVGLTPSTTYYFRIKAVNAAGSSDYSPVFNVSTPAAEPAPPVWRENGWYGHMSRNLILSEASDTHKIRLYFDELVPNPTSIDWLTPVMGAVWKRTTEKYGTLSDPYLYVVGNTPGPGYGGGGAVNQFDPRGSFRNIPWVAADNWGSIDWTSWDNVWKVHALTHELAHVVEAAAVGGYNGAPSVWEDSWWAYIFQYDIYKNLPDVFPDVFRRWKDEGLANRGDYGWYWARDWLIPIYEGEFGNIADANKGVNFLAKYFQLQAQHLPTLNGDFAPRPFTLGDYVHFCSGAAGVDLSAKAKLAFTWTPQRDLELARAKADFPAISALYSGSNQAPIFTFDPITRNAQINVPLSGQTLAGSATDPNPSDTLTYSKQSGPTWLNVAADGTLSGTPTATGTVNASVRVTDGGGLFDTATLTFEVSGGATTPCSGLCSNPISFAGPGYNSGNLGTGATCHQTTANLAAVQCGNFNAPRTFRVNGTLITCNGQGVTPPAKRNGGYCMQASAGEPAWAYFGTW